MDSTDITTFEVRLPAPRVLVEKRLAALWLQRGILGDHISGPRDRIDVF